MQTLDAAELLRISTKVITQAEHNIEPIELIKLAAMLPWLTKYELSEESIPYDDLYYLQDEMLVSDFDATITRLHETLRIG